MKNTTYCDIYFVRHGETDWNKNGILQGHTDTCLNENGKVQALQLKEKLKEVPFTKIFSSDLSRAHETAAIVINEHQSKITNTHLLRERKLGSWEGQPSSHFKSWIKEHSISTDAFKSKENYLSHKWANDVESYNEVYARVMKFITDILAEDKCSGPILCSTHGGVLCALLHILGDQFSFEHHWQITNCSYLILRVDENYTPSLLRYEGITQAHSGFIPF